MKKTPFIIVILCASLFMPFLLQGIERWNLDLEGGWAWNTYNEVAIPGDSGTRFSLTEDLEVSGKAFTRVRLSYLLGTKHQLSILYAPLELEASGTLPGDIQYTGQTFSRGSEVEGTYRFNSYRLTYRFHWVQSEAIDLFVGFTAKIRDAEIALQSAGGQASKTNVGFVPLLHLLVKWHFSPRWTLQLEADALAAKQGRAEDVQVALVTRLAPGVHWRAGYRFVEGGADVNEVYNFAFIHYLATGISLAF